MVFSEDIKHALEWLFSQISRWINSKQEEPPEPTDTVKALFILTGLFFVVRGNFDLMNYALRFILPMEDPSHIALSIICLGAIIGLGLHVEKPAIRVVAIVLAVCIVAMFSFIAYSQMHQTLIEIGDPNNSTRPDIMAAGQFGLIVMMEIFCFFLFFTFAQKSIAYTVFLLLTSGASSLTAS